MIFVSTQLDILGFLKRFRDTDNATITAPIDEPPPRRQKVQFQFNYLLLMT